MRINVNRGLTPNELQRSIKYYRIPVDTAFHIDTKLEEIPPILRARKINHEIEFFYAVDDQNRLYGVLSTKDILINPPETRLIDIIEEDIVTLHENVSVKHALKVLSDYQYLSVPMVDDEYRLIGLFEIRPTDLNFSRRFKKQPAKEMQDFLQILGFTIDKSKFDSKWAEYSYRMPWLIGNLFAGFICAAIAAYYELTLEKAIVLSMFIPLVLTLAESISMQSMTISLHFFYNKKIPCREIFQRIIHEWVVAILLGITSSLFLSIYYILGYGKEGVLDLAMLAIACSIFISMIIAATFGTFFPLILHRLNLDPKLAAGPVILMITDIATTAIYLGISTWIIL